MKFSKFNLTLNRNKNNHILFNTLYGTTFKIDSKTLEDINQGNIEELDTETKNMFLSRGILLNDNDDENAVYSYYFNKTKFDTQAINATILLTWACNFRCTYCYEGAGDDLSATMTGETANSICEFLITASQQKSSKYINVVLFGGEPLLNIGIGFEILDKLHTYCENNDKILTCSMVTNGSLLTDEVLNKLQYYNCTMIQITLDGPPEIHNTRRVAKTGSGTFEEVINGIRLVDKYSDNIHCVIRINVDKTNIEETDRLLKLIRESGIEHASVDFGIVRSSTNACSSYANNCFGEDELGDVLDDLWKKSTNGKFSIYPHPVRKWIYCGLFNDNNFTFAPTGDVYKCWEMVGDEDHKIGEIDSQGRLINISRAFYDWMSINPLSNDDCVSCKYLPVCGGGCIMTSINKAGTYHAKGCSKTKGVVEKQVINFIETVERAKSQNLKME